MVNYGIQKYSVITYWTESRVPSRPFYFRPSRYLQKNSDPLKNIANDPCSTAFRLIALNGSWFVLSEKYCTRTNVLNLVSSSSLNPVTLEYAQNCLLISWEIIWKVQENIPMNVQQLTADSEFYSCELSWKCFAFSYFSDVVDTTSNDCPRMPRLSGNALIKRLNDSSPEKLNVT